MQAGFGVGQLAFVDDEARFVFALHNCRNNLIEGHDLGLNSRREKPQRKIGGRERAGDRNLLVFDFAWRKSLGRDNHGAVAIAHAAAAGHQRIVVLNIWIGVERNSGDVVHAVVLTRLLVQGLDVTEGMRKAQPGDAHLVGGQRVEHESIIGVGTVRDADLTG